MCAAFGRVIGLDQEIVKTYVPGMVQHLRNLFEGMWDLYYHMIFKLLGIFKGAKIKIFNLITCVGCQYLGSARLTLLPPNLAAKWNLDAWHCFEQSALNALQLANQLTETCLEKLPPQDHKNEDDCIVSSLRQQKMAKSDIQRIVVDLFLAASDTVCK